MQSKMAALEDHQNQNQNNSVKGLGFLPRSCDACHAAAALLYCRAHAAFFCGACDCAVAGNRHERVWMCEVCEQAPAVVTCKADAAALCAACDADIHSANPLAHRHERVPVIPFLDSVADAALRSSSTATSALVNPPKAKGDDDDAEAWLIQNPSSRVLMADFLCSDSDLLDFGFNSQSNLEKVTLNETFDNNRAFAFGDSIVPTQSKGTLRICDDVNRAFENCFDIDFSQPDKHHNKLNSNEQLFSSFNYPAQHSASSSETGVVPEGNANSMSEVSYTFTKSITTSGVGDVLDGISSAVTGAPARATDREARVLRYREKRKNRKFEKKIRYASRKAYAETRPRIKGRFAKRTETNETSEIDVDQIYGFGSGSNGFLDYGGYGVVPSF